MSSLQPLLPWIGSKRRLRDEIIPLIPEHTCYVEPFCGSAAVYFGKEPSKVEVLNDVNDLLINLFSQIRDNSEAFYDRLWWLISSRKLYYTATDQLKYNASALSDIDKAVLYFFVIKNSFGSRFASGFGFARTQPPRATITNETLVTLRERLSNTFVENLSFERVIKNYDKPATFFYCDPPYTSSDNTKEYQHVFSPVLHEKFRALLGKIKGKFLLSYDDVPYIRDLYKGFNIKNTKPITYTLNQKHRTKCELLISNY
jgi:DNA adenine methylase